MAMRMIYILLLLTKENKTITMKKCKFSIVIKCRSLSTLQTAVDPLGFSFLCYFWENVHHFTQFFKTYFDLWLLSRFFFCLRSISFKALFRYFQLVTILFHFFAFTTCKLLKWSLKYSKKYLQVHVDVCSDSQPRSQEFTFVELDCLAGAN